MTKTVHQSLLDCRQVITQQTKRIIKLTEEKEEAKKMWYAKGKDEGRRLEQLRRVREE